MKIQSLLVVACLVVSSTAVADEPVEKLISRLGTGQKDVNDEIVRRGESAVKPLAKVLQDKNASLLIRMDAATLLSRIGGKNVVGPLKAALADQQLQYWAVYTLKSLGPVATEALPDLVNMLRERANDTRASGRLLLIEAVGSIGYGSKDAAEALALCMEENSCNDAALELAKLRVPGAEVLVSLAVSYSNDTRPYQDRRYGEAYAVLASGTPLPKETIPVFKKHFLKGGKYATVAGLGLACVGPPAIPMLKELLDEKDADLRAYAATSLATMNFHAQGRREYRGEKVPDPVSADEVYPKLKKLYKLPNGEVDWRIIQAMGRIGRKRFRSDPEMVKVLQEEFVKGVKKQEKQKDQR